MASAVLSGTFSEAPGPQTIQGSPHNQSDSTVLTEFLPWGAREAASAMSFSHSSPDPVPGPADPPATEGLAAPSRRPRSRKVSCPVMSSNGDLVGCGGKAGAGLGRLPGQHQGTAAGMPTAPPVPFPSRLML